MRVHFIAIGGAVMHNLAIALHKKGYQVTGSDDEIFEPSLSRLARFGLVPDKWGWYTERISLSIDAIILGMHAREDNPELLRAKELGLKIYSFPEYLYEQTKDKKRVVIAGSHGKTTITSMIMHALRFNKMNFDYMVGSVLEGFDTMVELDEKNEIAVFEGDEYLTSPIDKRPKFHLYQPHISLVSGIAWDHINVFPTFELYTEQFRIFASMITESLVYFEGDPILRQIAGENKKRLNLLPYNGLQVKTSNERSVIIHDGAEYPVGIFGSYNMQNLEGAMLVCKLIGLDEKDFLKSVATFKGAGKRQELLASDETNRVYLDFAHAPSKVKATVEAFREQFAAKKLIACLELHTFSSLSAEFFPHYKDSLNSADKAVVYFNPEVVAHKKLAPVSVDQVKSAFGRDDLIVVNDPSVLESILVPGQKKDQVLLIMTSGNFSGLNLKNVAKSFIEKCSLP